MLVSRVGRGTALEIGQDLGQGQRFCDYRLAWHNMIAMKVMTAETAVPLPGSDQLTMWHGERIMFEGQILMACDTKGRGLGHALPGMFLMARRTELGLELGTDLGKAWLIKAKDGMAVGRPVMAGQAGGIPDRLMPQVDTGAAPPQEIFDLGLDLLPHGARGTLVAGMAGERRMPAMHGASGMEVGEPGPAEQGQAETTRQQPNCITHLLALTSG
jgi:hypothetical protein